MPSLTPRSPNIGLYSDICATRSVTFDNGKLRVSAKSRNPIRSAGKNSCSGGSSKRIQTGFPSIIWKSSVKSARCIGSKRSSEVARSTSFSAKIISRMTDRRSASKNICSLRHNPMPSAWKFLAVCASRGVSAFARMPISRNSSAQVKSVVTASSKPASTVSTCPTRTSPNVPSTVIISPSRRIWLPRPITVQSCPLILISVAPTTHGRPSPLPITAAWLVTPPRSVRTATAACIPRISSGPVSRRTKTAASSRAAQACAAEAVNTILPVAAPGLAEIPLANTLRFASGATCLCSSSDKAFGSTRMSASSREITPSLAKLTAMCTAALDERIIRTASNITSLPFSIVNSICISSRRRCRASRECASSCAKTSGQVSSRDGPRGSLLR